MVHVGVPGAIGPHHPPWKCYSREAVLLTAHVLLCVVRVRALGSTRPATLDKGQALSLQALTGGDVLS